MGNPLSLFSIVLEALPASLGDPESLLGGTRGWVSESSRLQKSQAQERGITGWASCAKSLGTEHCQPLCMPCLLPAPMNCDKSAESHSQAFMELPQVFPACSLQDLASDWEYRNLAAMFPESSGLLH